MDTLSSIVTDPLDTAPDVVADPVDTLFLGPIETAVPSVADRYGLKPSGSADQGYFHP